MAYLKLTLYLSSQLLHSSSFLQPNRKIHSKVWVPGDVSNLGGHPCLEQIHSLLLSIVM